MGMRKGFQTQKRAHPWLTHGDLKNTMAQQHKEDDAPLLAHHIYVMETLQIPIMCNLGTTHILGSHPIHYCTPFHISVQSHSVYLPPYQYIRTYLLCPPIPVALSPSLLPQMQ